MKHRHTDEGDPTERAPLLPSVTRRSTGERTYTQDGGSARAPLRARFRQSRTASSDLESHASMSPFGTDVAQASANRDSRRVLVESLMDRGEFADPRINRSSLHKGQKMLLAALEGALTDDAACEMLPSVMIYKGRALKSTVVHLAVWCAAQLHEASLVELCLTTNSEDQCKALYQLPSRKEGWSCELHLDALHVACGLGSLSAVEALIAHSAARRGDGGSTTSRADRIDEVSERRVREYVNTFTVKHFVHNENPNNRRDESFYQPIHEAADRGFIDIVAVLLHHGAEGGTPNSDGVAPLHMVAMRGIAGGISTCDHNGLRKVVQQLQETGGSLDVPISTKHWNAKLAGKTPVMLAAADDSRFPRNMMGLLVPCLQEKSIKDPEFFFDINFLATLDQEAATDVVRSFQVRAAKNPSLLERFRMDAQRKGSTDMLASIFFLAPEAGGMMLEMLLVAPLVKDPSHHNIPTRTNMYGFWNDLRMRCIYREDAAKRDDIAVPIWDWDTDQPDEQQTRIAWHTWLVPRTDTSLARSASIYNITVSTLLLPNSLDLDIMQALARTSRSEMKVFSRVAVQGLVNCLWDNLVNKAWLADFLFRLLELLTLMWWSLAWPLVGPRGAINADKPLCWAIITAGAFRDTIHLITASVAFMLKYQGHTDATMRGLWDPTCAANLRWLVPRSAMLVIQYMFILGSSWHLGYSELSEADQVLLAVLVLMKSTLVTFMFRLCSGGTKIYAIFYSFLGGATREMISITAMVFASFSLAFLCLAKDKAAGWVLANSYRGLLFGDGDGFNNLGMDIDEENYMNNNGTLTAFLVMGSLFFNIILLNLIIAVYGNEYNKVAGETPSLFLHGRASGCVMYIMSCNMLPWLGFRFNSALKLAAAACFSVGAYLHLRGTDEDGHERYTALLIAASQILLQAALVQCEWFSIEGIAANKADHFLWVCHREDTDYLESIHEPLPIGHFEERLDETHRYIDDRMASLEEKLDAILEHLGSAGAA